MKIKHQHALYVLYGGIGLFAFNFLLGLLSTDNGGNVPDWVPQWYIDLASYKLLGVIPLDIGAVAIGAALVFFA